MPVAVWQNFTNISSLYLGNDRDTEYDELSDGEISKLLIVAQTPVRPQKHKGFDRTEDYTYESRAKMSQDLATVINDGLYYYEQDLWHDHDTEDETWAKFYVHEDSLYTFILFDAYSLT